MDDLHGNFCAKLIYLEELLMYETAVLEVVEDWLEVGKRVNFKPELPNPGNYMPGELISATIVSSFENGGKRTYRLELDVVWRVTCHACQLGKKIVVGNISELALSRM